MRFPGFLAALLIAGCAAVPPAPIPLDGLPAAFEMSGRLSVAQGDRGEILRLRWRHAPSSDTWVLATPVGTEVARVEGRSGEITVHRPGASPVTAESFAALTERLLGAALDDRLLVAWLHGRPLAGPEGWEVDIEGTRRLGDADVARRISARRDDTRVRLVVDDYRPSP